MPDPTTIPAEARGPQHGGGAEDAPGNEPIGRAADASDPRDNAAVHAESVPSMEQLRAELKDCQERYLRAKAEQQNMVRRLADEKANALRYANADFARSILPVVDNMERLLSGLGESQQGDPFADGARLVYELLRKTLAQHGVQPVDALGKPFDPSVHEAIRRDETAEAPPGTVTAEYEKGYVLADRVLRASKVAIAVERQG